MSEPVATPMMAEYSTSFCRKTRSIPTGESPSTQSRRPSRLNMGKINRVVRVESVRLQTPKLRLLSTSLKSGLLGSASAARFKLAA
jgi:hypothetical protein